MLGQAQIHPVGCVIYRSAQTEPEPYVTNPDSQRVAQAFGYTPEQLQSVPAESHMGLSCGNPVAAATLREVGLHQVQVSTKLT